MAFSKTIWNGATTIDVVEGQQYIINGFVRVNDDPINNSELIRLLFKPIGYSLNDLDTWSQIAQTTTRDKWIELSTTFTAKATGGLKAVGLYQEYSNEGTNTTGNCDLVTFKGPLDTLTEKKTIIYDSECLYKNFEVKFLDALGGYSYWTFRTYADEGIEFGDTRQIKRNIFADFPNDFKNAQVQSDFVQVDSKDTVTLRAENLTEQQYRQLLEMIRSMRAYDNNNKSKPKALLINKVSKSFTQGEKLYNLTINATYTFDNYRQRQ